MMRKSLIVVAVVLGLGGAALGVACTTNVVAPEKALDLHHLDDETAESLIGRSMGTDRETLEAHIGAFLVLNDLGDIDAEIVDLQSITGESNLEQLAWRFVTNIYALMVDDGALSVVRGPSVGQDDLIERILQEDAAVASQFAEIRWSRGEERWTTHAFVYARARVGNPFEVLEPMTGTAIAAGVFARGSGTPARSGSSSTFLSWATMNEGSEEDDGDCTVSATCDEGGLDCGGTQSWDKYIGSCHITHTETIDRNETFCGGTCTKTCTDEFECLGVGSSSTETDTDTTDDCCSQ